MDIIVLIDKLPTRGHCATRRDSNITGVVVHNDGAPPPRSARAEVERIIVEAHFHIEKRRWHCLGYHYVIGPTGRVYKCNPVTWVTAHAYGGNRPNIGVALQGNFEIGPPSTDAQLAALAELLGTLHEAIPSIANVIPHRRVLKVPVKGHGTDCPGRLLSDARIAEIAQAAGIG